MKTLPFILILLFIGVYQVEVFGQERDSLKFYDSNEDIDDDYLWADYRYSNPKDEWLMGDDTLDHPLISRNVTIRFTTKATAYLRIDVFNPEVRDKEIFLTDGSDIIKPLNNLIGTQGDLVIDRLAIDRFYYVGYSSQKELVNLAVISTHERFSETDEIELSQHMFDEVSRWLGQPSGQNLFQFVQSQSNWHQLEKIWFIQQFVYYGRSLPDSHPLSVPAKPDNQILGTSGTDDCLCRPLRLTVSIDNEPSVGRTQIDDKNGNWNNVWGGGTNVFNGNSGKRWHGYGMRGPAKYNQVWIETPKCTGGNVYNNTLGFDEKLLNGSGEEDVRFAGFTRGNKAILKYVFACVDVENFIPKDCSCDRQMGFRVCYRYASQVNVETDILSGGLCKKENGVRKSTLAQAEDLVFLAWTDDDISPDNFKVQASGMIAVGLACGQSANWEEYAVSMFSAGVYAYLALKPSSSPLNISEAIKYGARLARQIESITTPFVSHSESCGFQEVPGAGLINNCLNINLHINKTAVAVLQSNSITHVQGQGRFKANARVLSAYGMTGTLQRSDPDVAGEICCRTGSGVYNYAGTMGFNLLTEAGLRSWVSANFTSQGIDLIDDISNISGQFGFRGGGVRQDCLMEIEHDPVSGRSISNIHDLSLHDITLEQRADHIYIHNLLEGEWELMIMDLSGKVLHLQNGTGNHTELIPLNDLKLNPGMFISAYRYGNANIKYLKVIKQ